MFSHSASSILSNTDGVVHVGPHLMGGVAPEADNIPFGTELFQDKVVQLDSEAQDKVVQFGTVALLHMVVLLGDRIRYTVGLDHSYSPAEEEFCRVIVASHKDLLAADRWVAQDLDSKPSLFS